VAEPAVAVVVVARRLPVMEDRVALEVPADNGFFIGSRHRQARYCHTRSVWEATVGVGAIQIIAALAAIKGPAPMCYSEVQLLLLWMVVHPQGVGLVRHYTPVTAVQARLGPVRAAEAGVLAAQYPAPTETQVAPPQARGLVAAAVAAVAPTPVHRV